MTNEIRRLGKFLQCLIIITLIASSMTQEILIVPDPNNLLVTIPSWLNSSQTEYNQFLEDQYNYFVTPKGNRVWTCAMSMAWNELKRGFLGGSNVTFSNTSILQQKIIDNFNAERFSKSQLNENSYYVSSGFGQSAVDKINLEIREKFPERTFQPLEYNISEADFISFAYLYKSFRYRNAFEDLPSFYFNGKMMQGFQALNSKQKSQIYYKYYNNSKNFMIGIETDNSEDEILLWKTNQTEVNSAKFDKILSSIELFSQMPSIKISKIDRFQMPVIDVDYSRKYSDLAKLRFSNPGFQDYIVSQANQKLKVKMTRTGVTVENDGEIVILVTSIFGSKSFILNSDFWLIMKEKNKKPYLVMLIKETSQKLD